MIKLIHLIFCALTMLVSLCAYADKPDDLQWNLSLPIDAASSPKLQLSVSIPKEYVSIQPLENLTSFKLIEFIPKGESPDNWSTLIALQSFKGVEMQVDQFLAGIKQGIEKQSEEPIKIIDKTITPETGYAQGSIAIQYTFNKQKILVYMRYFAGSYDISGIQYTTVIKDGEDLKATLEQIKTFVDKHTNVVAF